MKERAWLGVLEACLEEMGTCMLYYRVAERAGDELRRVWGVEKNENQSEFHGCSHWPRV